MLKTQTAWLKYRPIKRGKVYFTYFFFIETFNVFWLLSQKRLYILVTVKYLRFSCVVIFKQSWTLLSGPRRNQANLLHLRTKGQATTGGKREVCGRARIASRRKASYWKRETESERRKAETAEEARTAKGEYQEKSDNNYMNLTSYL